jgi:hypothetical protein
MTRMDRWWISAVFGGGLTVGGGLLVAWHLRSWRGHQSDTALDERERSFHAAQFRRRVQASGLLAVIGLLVILGDLDGFWRPRPALWAAHWGLVMLLTMWLMLLGLADLLASRVHGQAALGRVLRKQRELERELDDMRRQHARQTNGHRSEQS